MTTLPNAPTNPYPLTLTREALVGKGACAEGLKAFDTVCPADVLTIPDAWAHSALLTTPLATYEAWAVKEGLLPPVCVQGPDGTTVAAGYRGTATAGAEGTATAGCEGTATAGDNGTATAGYQGHATAGYQGHATAGDYGTATAGDEGTATAGYQGHATAGNYGTAIAGAKGTATAGHYGTATAGVGGTATAGVGGTATAGDYGAAATGYRGTATAGADGVLRLAYRANDRLRWAIAYVGEDGVEPHVPYKVDLDGKVVRAS